MTTTTPSSSASPMSTRAPARARRRWFDAPLPSLMLLCLFTLVGAGAPALPPEWVPVLLLLGAALVKAVMSILDASGALEKLPPWLRPQVTAAQAAVVGVLGALAGGVSTPDAILAALGVMGISHHAHATMRGLRAPPPTGGGGAP